MEARLTCCMPVHMGTHAMDAWSPNTMMTMNTTRESVLPAMSNRHALVRFSNSCEFHVDRARAHICNKEK